MWHEDVLSSHNAVNPFFSSCFSLLRRCPCRKTLSITGRPLHITTSKLQVMRLPPNHCKYCLQFTHISPLNCINSTAYSRAVWRIRPRAAEGYVEPGRNAGNSRLVGFSANVMQLWTKATCILTFCVSNSVGEQQAEHVLQAAVLFIYCCFSLQ